MIKVNISTEDMLSVLDLMDRLPVDREENVERLNHTLRHGHLLLLKEDGEVKGCAELFRVKRVPAYPVLPWPKDDPKGKFVYCFSAVTEKNRIRDLINLAKVRFSECKKIIWHTEKRNHKLNFERI